ncbi:MAG TPA: nuclease-related domain-containing protein [Cyclobacteriaceae bacterium]|nr:nuclease-related domain-containing protein [Cyclobacteriaceae bacterium]HRJ80388.1 nuclease-related domain-containing protein [Cyclobacteriaceae bacterium]
MCKIINTIGSLTTIKKRLSQNNIDGFHSINDLLAFRDNYSVSRQQTIFQHETLITEEKNRLNSEVLLLQNEISKEKSETRQRLKSEIDRCQQQFDEIPEIEKSVIGEFTYSFKALFLLIYIYYKKLFFNLIVYFSVWTKVKALKKKNIRLDYLNKNFEEEVKISSRQALYELDRKKVVIDEMNSFIYGAIGEQKVVKELEQLSDEYILINDFTFSFNKPIYSRTDKQSIKSIQIDHLLISPSGIFLIETKNWSKNSMESLSLRSPVAQIKRTSYALYKILSDYTKSNLDKHHWGERKISIRNLIVIINRKPKEEFEYVKILTLNELLGYIDFFKPSLSNTEMQNLADYLISINTQN